MEKRRVKPRRVLPFYKIHGAGNDILVFDSARLKCGERQKPRFIRTFAHRQLGIGSDQVLEILSYKPLAVQFWNCDGSKAEMCANGSRAFLRLAVSEGWAKPNRGMVPLMVGGKAYVGLVAGQHYSFSLGIPQVSELNSLKLGALKIPYRAVNVGNPHAIIWLGNGAKKWRVPKVFDYKVYGPRIEHHARFPARTNVSFVYKCTLRGKKLIVRADIWERGAGATLSCGSGAVATAAALRQDFPGVNQVEIQAEFFTLAVKFAADGSAWLSGPTEIVAEGRFNY